MLPVITSTYAALLAFFFIFLSMRVIRARREESIALGDGGNEKVRRAMRVQANFAEYVPLALLLIAFAEMQGLVSWMIHLLALLLLAGRLVHAYGVSQLQENYNYRVTGMVLTFGAIAGSSLMLLGAAVL